MGKVYEEKKKGSNVDLDPALMREIDIIKNLNYLKHLDPIDRHLWWLALMVKISLAMIIFSFLMSLLSITKCSEDLGGSSLPVEEASMISFLLMFLILFVSILSLS